MNVRDADEDYYEQCIGCGKGLPAPTAVECLKEQRHCDSCNSELWVDPMYLGEIVDNLKEVQDGNN